MTSGGIPMIVKAGPVGGYNPPLVPMDTTGVTRILKIALWETEGFVGGLSLDFDRSGRMDNHMLGRFVGRKVAEITFQPSEYIIGVKGQTGKYSNNATLVKSISIQTNQQIYGPYGGSGGSDFEFPVIDTETTRAEIIGFHGSQGLYLDSVGVYYKLTSKTSGGGGGSNVGGNAIGGDASGGAATGGRADGGRAKGETAKGGTATGGDAKGEWISTGGDGIGGDATGTNSSTGGNATGGKATGGNAAGGDASGGNASGGSGTGGTATGGNAAGSWSAVGGSAVGGSSE